MKRLMISFALAAICSGCVSFCVREEHKKQIAAYRQDGSLRQAKTDVGRTGNPVPTLCWAIDCSFWPYDCSLFQVQAHRTL